MWLYLVSFVSVRIQCLSRGVVLGGVGGLVCVCEQCAYAHLFSAWKTIVALRARANGLWYVHLRNEHALTMWHVQVCVAPDTSRNKKVLRFG